MTMALFFEWLKRFEAYISKTADRTVFLLLDNFSGHGTKDNLPALASVRVEFLPPNTTSKLQPLDAKIMCSLKRRCRSAQYNRAINTLEEGTRDIYNISQLTAMRYLNRIWKELPCSIIANYWRSTGIMGTNALTEQSVAVAKKIFEECTELHTVISDLVHTWDKMSVRDLVNADDTDVTSVSSCAKPCHTVWQGFAHDDMVDCVFRL